MDQIAITSIQQHFPKLNCEFVETIESTQSSVKANGLLVAEQQTAGVGRRGKHWLTPAGRAICFSYRFHSPLPANQLAGFQIIVALAVLASTKKHPLSCPIQLKWPNDLYASDKKFAGILINLTPQGQVGTDINVGVGINWRLSEEQLQSVNQPVTNVPLTKRPPRTAFIIELIEHIQHNHHLFIDEGLLPFLNTWNEADYLQHKSISVEGEQASYSGQYAGISPSGALMLSTDTGIKHFSGGEVSVKPV